jgi:mono/diheme cytochrome c family protein
MLQQMNTAEAKHRETMRAMLLGLVVSLAPALSVAQEKSAALGVKANPDHGRYLAENVAMCIQCHTPREANGTLIHSKLYEGAAIPVAKPVQWNRLGNRLGNTLGNTWAEFAPRIAGLPQYSEEQFITLLTTGIGREGKPLRAPMPTFTLTRQDAGDIAAYLKSLK